MRQRQRWKLFRGHPPPQGRLLRPREQHQAAAGPNADVHKTNDSEFTPLHCAAGSGHEGSIRLLLDANANVNETNESGRIPLHLAAYNGHEARLLLDANADLGIKDLDGETARDKAKSDAMRALVDDAPRKEPNWERPHAVAGGAL